MHFRARCKGLLSFIPQNDNETERPVSTRVSTLLERHTGQTPQSAHARFSPLPVADAHAHLTAWHFHPESKKERKELVLLYGINYPLIDAFYSAMRNSPFFPPSTITP